MIGVCDVWVVRCRSGERESVVWGPGPRARGARRRAAAQPPRYNSHAARRRAAVIDSRRARRGGAGTSFIRRSRSAESSPPGRRIPPTAPAPGERRVATGPAPVPGRVERSSSVHTSCIRVLPACVYATTKPPHAGRERAAVRGAARRDPRGRRRVPPDVARRATIDVGIVLSRPRRRVVGSHQSSVNEASPGVLLQSWCGTRSTGASAARTPLRSK